jgi:hypothetical protein
MGRPGNLYGNAPVEKFLSTINLSANYPLRLNEISKRGG